MLYVNLIVLPITHLLGTAINVMLTVTTAIVIVIVLSGQLGERSVLVRQRFFDGLSTQRLRGRQGTPVGRQFTGRLLRHSLRLTSFRMGRGSPDVKGALGRLGFHRGYGIGVMAVVQKRRQVGVPKKRRHLCPFSGLMMINTSISLRRFHRCLIRQCGGTRASGRRAARRIGVRRFAVTRKSRLVKHAVLRSNVQSESTYLIVNVRQNSSSVGGPSPSAIFRRKSVM